MFDCLRLVAVYPEKTERWRGVASTLPELSYGSEECGLGSAAV